ncbi:hypothetical protein [uncultured Dialister sp.]|uniref:hypothetical protein n=1 Tax=uncultured Dialister sp. TaxID=278064 RepID=UPI00261787E3|nr:hypothetical protein [uncultured Dialister sp.]
MDLEYLRNKIIKLVEEKGHPRELGALVADNLGSENTMIRMIGYLSHSQPQSTEEIADEMLAICEDRDNWRKKKEAEFYQQKYNQYLWEMKK